MELLYAGDLVLYWESQNEVMEKYRRWENAVEGKGLTVNVGKTRYVCISYLGRKV